MLARLGQRQRHGHMEIQNEAFRACRASGLGEQFKAAAEDEGTPFGERLAALVLFFWHYHTEKLVKKRAHPQGSPDVWEAAHLRYQTYWHYGHRN